MTLMLQKLTLIRLGAAEWVRHSVLWSLFNPLRHWRQHSFLMQWGTELSVCLLSALFAIAPFVGTATGYIGILTVGCAGLWLLLTFSEDAPQPAKISPVHALLALYWICAGVSTALSPAKREAMSGLAELSLYLIGFALMERTVRVKRWRDWLIVVYLLASFAVALYGLRQCIFGEKPLATWVDPDSSLANVTRAFSYLGNPNLLASYLLPSVPLSLAATFLWKARGAKLLGSAIFVANTICLIMTLCRGAWIGLVASLALMGVLVLYWFLPRLPKFWRVWSIPALLGGGTLALVIAILIIPPLRERVFSIFASRGDSSNNYRLNVYEAVKEMIRDRPIFGIGPGHDVFNKIYPLYQRPKFSALSAYSIFLEHWVEFGIFGFTCFMALLVSIFQQGWMQLQHFRAQQNPDGLWTIAVLVSMCGLLVHGTVDTVWYRPQVLTLWWLLAAIATSYFVPARLNDSSPMYVENSYIESPSD